MVTLSVLLFSGRCINSVVVWGGVGGGYERDIMVYEGALYVPLCLCRMCCGTVCGVGPCVLSLYVH